MPQTPESPPTPPMTPGSPFPAEPLPPQPNSAPQVLVRAAGSATLRLGTPTAQVAILAAAPAQHAPLLATLAHKEPNQLRTEFLAQTASADAAGAALRIGSAVPAQLPSSSSGISATPLPPGFAFPELGAVPPLDCKEVVLPSGLRLFMVQDNEAPLITGALVFPGGSLSSPKQQVRDSACGGALILQTFVLFCNCTLVR